MPTRSRKFVILVADDTLPQVEALANVINDAHDMSTVTAVGAPAALRAALESHPDVVVINIIKAGETEGWKTLESLRRHTATQTIPIVMVIQEATRAEEQRALSGGVSRCFSSWLPSELLREIRRLAK